MAKQSHREKTTTENGSADLEQTAPSPEESEVTAGDGTDAPAPEPVAAVDLAGTDIPVTEDSDQDAPGEPESPETRVAHLEEEVARLQDQLLRSLAEFDNYRKRRDREVIMLREAAQATLLRDFLAIVDDLDRTVTALEEHRDGDALTAGVRLVHTKMHDVLEKNGVTPFEAVGREFDPALHEAMSQQPQAESPSNQVIQEFERGYMFHEKVLRHAKVVVSA